MADTHQGETRRDFLYVATTAVGAIGAACVAWPFIDQMNPAADVLALASIEFDTTTVAEGMAVTVTWRGQPVFVRHRTAAAIEQAKAVPPADLPDPPADAPRTPTHHSLMLVGFLHQPRTLPLLHEPAYPPP